MPSRQSIQLGQVQETLLIPLYARAIESRRKRPILEDPKAVEMVEAINWDFRKFGQRERVIACALRTIMFDAWVEEFLQRYPEGTVVEIGAGLNTRFERLDNGRLHWLDLDLPDTVELRQKFFTDTERRTTLAGSVLDPGWMAAVRRCPGPYFFVAEAVLIYLEEPQVKAALAQIAGGFPGVSMAFDTGSRRAVNGGNKDFANRKLAARFAWACDDPKEIEDWNIGLRLVESRTMVDVPEPLRSRLSLPMRTSFRIFRRFFPKLVKAYQLNLFSTHREATVVSTP
ncbi:MAG: class I SAM-dependent methyltransferase [Acidobacteriia bacterium]|nr:class I SAM-dependent methyltransferase [Terriglobia bacterium]